MSPRPSSRPAADRLWQLIPGLYRGRLRDDGRTGARDAPQDAREDARDKGARLLRGLVGALGVGLDAAQADVLRLLDDLFIETCDPKLVPLIGDLVGISVDPEVPVERQRHQVKYAVHLRRRRGTVEQLETLGFQITGFRTRVREAPSPRRTVKDPPRAARLSGALPAEVGATTAEISGQIPAGKLSITMDVAWPVRRAQRELVTVGPDVHAVDARGAVGLRRADGTPIFMSDDPTLLVGPGLPIEVALIGADLGILGPLRPRFMNLAGASVYVPHRTLAIDPERGRVAGPTAPMPGIRAYRRYQLCFWEPLRGEAVTGAPASHGKGVFTFAADGRTAGLTDASGQRIRVGFEGERSIPAPSAGERLLIVRTLGWPRRALAAREAPFVILPPGVPWQENLPPERQGLLLDTPGLGRLFSIEDAWGWDLFRDVRICADFGRGPPPDDTVEVDVERGRFRVGPAHEKADLCVRYHRPYDVVAIGRRGQEAILRALPLGRSAKFLFRDTACGGSEVP